MGFFKNLEEEYEIVKQRDPAIRSKWEVLLYPYYTAKMAHKKSHRLYQQGHYFRARWISQRASRKTGIEIHPGATIGKGFFIDHGTGVVIGETAEIGENVTLFHGVTLGGTGKDTGKRHPTICDNVTIYAESSLLGPITIGENTIIGAASVILEDVPPNTTVVGTPMVVVKRRCEEGTLVYHRDGTINKFIDKDGKEYLGEDARQFESLFEK